MNSNKAVLLLSGGIDSATCGAIAKENGFDIYGLSFHYGQRHAFELQAAATIAAHLGITTHKIIKIDLSFITTSSLISDMPVEKSRNDDSSIPSTYVPARNALFLTYALAWAEVLKAANIFIGVTAVDYSGYPDCRPEFIASFQAMANIATKEQIEGNRLTIHTPLISLSKAEIIKTGYALGLDYSLTHSCYDPDNSGRSCGTCDSCRHRKKGFHDAGIPDPTRYIL